MANPIDPQSFELANWLDSELNSIAEEISRKFSSPDHVRARIKYKQGLRLTLISLIDSEKQATKKSRRAVQFEVMSEVVGLSRSQLNLLIALLTQRGLITKVTAEEPSYKLAKDAFTQVIWNWIAPQPPMVEKTRNRSTNRKIIQECIDEDRTLTIKELNSVTQSAASLGLSRLELNTIFLSSLLNFAHPDYWFRRLQDEGIPTQPIIQSIQVKPDYRDRLSLIKSLFNLGKNSIESLQKLLDDEYPQVRAAAIAALVSIAPDRKWHEKLTKECFIPGGEFTVGTKDGYIRAEETEQKITVSEFFMEKTPVTNKEYLLFSKERSKSFVIETEKEQHPVVNITWFEAQAYADWGSLRLPSEVEWEIAASRPSGQKQDIKKRKYPWNGSFAENRCNTRANNLGTTTPVGRFSPQGDSFCGCVDMAGNVWEWTNSLFRAYPYRAENENENSDETGSRVIRGGSFRTGPAFATCTARQSFNPYGKKDDLGFRCALKLPDVNEWIESEIINE